MQTESLTISVVGGAGHVGLPLSLLLAKAGFRVNIIDIDKPKVEALNRGEFPFLEEGGPELLQEVGGRCLRITSEVRWVSESDVIILVTGTPIDEYMNPKLSAVYDVVDQVRPYMRDGQVVIMRSTLFPGTSEKIHALLKADGLNVGLCFCPERTKQGQALQEMPKIPQIISGSDETAVRVARTVFSSIAPSIIELSMTEAELAKLYTNAWRYIKFAVANQFHMIAFEKGLDYHRVRRAIADGFDRAADLPTAGFTAGPCLLKDTMQLAAYDRGNFTLGHAAVLVNEMMPDYMVEKLKQEGPVAEQRIGILGMAFKADSDDIRDSLAYKLKKLLKYEGADVMCTDPYVKDPELYPLQTVLDNCDIVFIGCPHSAFRDVDFHDKRVIDIWNFIGEV